MAAAGRTSLACRTRRGGWAGRGRSAVREQVAKAVEAEAAAVTWFKPGSPDKEPSPSGFGLRPSISSLRGRDDISGRRPWPMWITLRAVDNLRSTARGCRCPGLRWKSGGRRPRSARPSTGERVSYGRTTSAMIARWSLFGRSYTAKLLIAQRVSATMWSIVSGGPVGQDDHVASMPSPVSSAASA